MAYRLRYADFFTRFGLCRYGCYRTGTMVQVAAGGVGLLCQFGAVISCGVSYQKNVAVRISYIVGIGFAVLASHTAYENRFTFLQHLLLFGSDFRSVNRVADFQCEIVAGGKISSPVKRIDTQRSRYELTVAAFDILYENGFTAAQGFLLFYGQRHLVDLFRNLHFVYGECYQTSGRLVVCDVAFAFAPRC